MQQSQFSSCFQALHDQDDHCLCFFCKGPTEDPTRVDNCSLMYVIDRNIASRVSLVSWNFTSVSPEGDLLKSCSLRLMTATLLVNGFFRFSNVQVIDLSRGRIPRLSVGPISRWRGTEAICDTVVSAVSGVEAPKSFRLNWLKGSSSLGHNDAQVSAERSDVTEGSKPALNWWRR